MFSKLGRINRLLKSVFCEVLNVDGIREDMYFSPKGLYSKPVKEPCVTIPLVPGKGKNVVLCFQKPVENVKDKDVMLTDDKSSIHLSYDGATITIKADNIKIAGKLEVTGEATFKGGSVKHGEIEIGNTHTHPAGKLISATPNSPVTGTTGTPSP